MEQLSLLDAIRGGVKAVQLPQAVEHEVVQRMAMLILATVRGGEATVPSEEACRDD